MKGSRILNLRKMMEAANNEYFNHVPDYDTPGRILVRVKDPTNEIFNWNYDVLDWDRDSGVFWINNGKGFDVWLDDNINFDEPGFYVVENVMGCYLFENRGPVDDDIIWEYDEPREATPEEIESETLS